MLTTQPPTSPAPGSTVDDQVTSCDPFPTSVFEKLRDDVRTKSLLHTKTPTGVCPALHVVNEGLLKIKDQHPGVCSEEITDFLTCLQMNLYVPVQDVITCNFNCDYEAQGCETWIKASRSSCVCNVYVHVPHY